MRSWTACGASLAFALLLAAPPAAAGADAAREAGSGEEAEPLALETLMRGMAESRGVVARFREVKEVSLLAEPVVSRGVLYFVPPDRLARHVTEPGDRWLRVDGERLSFRDETGEDALDLGESPVAREIVENLVVLFRGDLPALRERYAVRFEAEEERWTLRLEPRAAPLADYVERVVLRGEGRALREMVWRETDGDRTITTFTRVEADRPLSAAERRRAFPAPEDAGAS